MNKPAKKIKTPQRKKKLTPAQKKFAQVYAKTDNATEAARQSFPTIKSNNYLRVKGHRLMTNENVDNEIQRQKQMLEELATQAVHRVGDLINSDNEQIATTNSWNTIRQVQGNPTNKTETTTLSIEALLTDTDD